jgi:hypothetical protein
MYEEYELIDSIESAKLPIYIPVKKIGGQPLIRSLRSGSPGAESGPSRAESGVPQGTLLPNIRSPGQDEADRSTNVLFVAV